MKEKLGIEYKDSTFQSFVVKMIFVFYALPLLVLSDLLGMGIIIVIEKIYLPNNFQENNMFRLAAYFAIGFSMFIFVVSKVETIILSKQWKEIPKKRLRMSIVNSNIIIFTFAVVVIMVMNNIN